MKLLLTGGAGYIGSVVATELAAAGAKPIVVDNLSAGHRPAPPQEALFIEGEIGDAELLEETIRKNKVEAVIHLAASCLVGDSISDPAAYYRNNVSNGLALLETMRAAGVRRIVFSSSAAVYGNARQIPIDEDAPTDPINPYGETKLIFERALHWYDRAYDFRFASLRYFNAAGATGDRGEDHDPETHLIPRVLKVALGQAEAIDVFGADYETDDGTCVRDYVHVSDLARAHILALKALDRGSRTFNLGGGSGASVRHVIETAREVTGHPIPERLVDRRPGDPPSLVASFNRIDNELGWKPERSDLRPILESAWEWQRAHPEGYNDA
ncbi:MAG: UDP-glucose 4-epimerase GalE [Planctomycetota bacterium]|nr:UDP-glucose 4-epimerase GalE [Planctomycetota bacterium]